jgi:hypothetical protein
MRFRRSEEGGLSIQPTYSILDCVLPALIVGFSLLPALIAKALWPPTDEVEMGISLGLAAFALLMAGLGLLLLARDAIELDAGRRTLVVTTRLFGLGLRRRQAPLHEVREIVCAVPETLERASYEDSRRHPHEHGPKMRRKGAPEASLRLTGNRTWKLRTTSEAEPVEQALAALRGELRTLREQSAGAAPA